MNNKLVSNENITKTPPDWQHPVLPGNFVQGQLLMTVNSGAEPPLDPSNFKWILMEKLNRGVKIRLDYNEELNEYTILEGHGHLNNDDQFVYDWEIVGKFEGLTPEVAEELRRLVYVAYRYDTDTPNTLRVYGINKAGQEILLCDINFVSAQVLEQAVLNINNRIDDEVDTLNDSITTERERAINRENEIETQLDNKITVERERAIERENQLEELVENAGVVSGLANEIVENADEEKQINVRYDDQTIKVNADNKLFADIIDDTQTSTTKTWSSFEIARLIDGDVKYKGDVQTYEDLPTEKSVGDIYYVMDTGNSYIWNGEIWRDWEENYQKGQGIDITNRVISAKIGQGLEFDNQDNIKAKINKGLEFDNTGKTNAKIGEGLEFGTTNEIKTKVGNGIDLLNGEIVAKAQNSKGIVVDANGIGIKTNESLMFINGNLSKSEFLSYNQGIKREGTFDPQTNLFVGDIGINTNFNVKTTPLEDRDSKLSIYSDGKIAVDVEDVILSGDLLATFTIPNGQNYVLNGRIPNVSKYDMLYIVHRGIFGEYIQKPAQTIAVRTTVLLPSAVGSPGQTPNGATALMILIRDFNPTAEIFSRLDIWAMQTWGTWVQATSTPSSPRTVDIYGMRAQ